MAKLKISDFDIDPANNTDINSINIAEGCAPSGINNAIRQLMSDLKEFQTGAGGDPFNGAVNGTVGATTPASGAFTSLSASGAFSANGGATLGDASGDALTINSSAVSIPNGLNFDSNTLVIDATNNRVGVNNASPSNALDVTGTYISIKRAGAVAGYSITDTSANKSAFYQYTNGTSLFIGAEGTTPIVFANTDALTERMRITSAGNVGIGTSSPAAALSANPTTASTIGLSTYTGNETAERTTIAAFAGAAISSYQSASGSPYTKVTDIVANGDGTVPSVMRFWTKTNGQASATERMRIDSSGNVGIGTTAPNYKLEVYNASNPRLSISSSNTGSGELRFSDPDLGYAGLIEYAHSSDSMRFYSAGTERMRIDSSGNLLVGTTGASGRVAAAFPNSQYGFTGICTSTSGTAFFNRFLYNSSTEVGTISSTGTTTSYNTSSDYRLKDITGNLTGYKERIMALQPKQGTWKADGSVFKGFVAHEFAEQYPNAVSGEKDAVDENGNPVYQGMQAGGSETIADLVALVKELVAEVDSLKAQLNKE
jgi:hypothetical protein